VFKLINIKRPLKQGSLNAYDMRRDCSAEKKEAWDKLGKYLESILETE